MTIDRRRRREETRAAKASHQKEEKQAKLGFWDRISTDVIMGGLILLVILIAAGVFVGGRLIRSTPTLPEVPFQQVFTVAAVPNQANTLLVGDVTGLYRSQNGGATWERVAFGNTAVHAIAPDAANPAVLYAAAGDRVRRSENSGESWRDVTTNLPRQSILSLAKDPSGSAVSYAFVKNFGLYRSEDLATWQQVAALPTDEITALAMKPGAVDTLFAFHSSRGLVRSSDGGKNFSPVTATVLPVRAVTGLLTFSEEPETLYAVAGRGVYKSSDGGVNWKSSSEGLKDVSVVSLSRDTAGTLYAVDIQAAVHTSSNGGQSWSKS